MWLDFFFFVFEIPLPFVDVAYPVVSYLLLRPPSHCLLLHRGRNNQKSESFLAFLNWHFVPEQGDGFPTA